MFVEQQQGLQLLPSVLQVVENLVYVKVFAPNYIILPIELKIGCDLILNLLRLDSKQELVQMYNNQ